ncbi:MAG: GNAT family N-acetyltransferase [Williamsia herbipolensis]|nr:GNAT family N-acetyltransferase [Williamsia herbipolensis]
MAAQSAVPQRVSELGPIASRAGEVLLRPLARSDGSQWRQLRVADEAWLRPWEVSSSMSWEERHSAGAWRRHRRELRGAEIRGEAIALAICVDREFAGQVTVGGIQRGVLRSGWIGYWVGSRWQNRGVATVAVALAVDFALSRGGLHRVEATIAPANVASRTVVSRLGFRQEGLLERYLDVDGRWQDHLLFAMTAEEVVRPLTERLAGILERPPRGHPGRSPRTGRDVPPGPRTATDADRLENQVRHD